MTGKTCTRTAALSVAALALTVATAGPAAAHAEVEADGARALDQNVALTFTADSESASAGISKLEVVLPEGVSPQDVTYEKGPEGWKFTPTGRGYTVSGPKLAAGEDVEHVVIVRQLPDVKELVFKTLQSYSDGRIDRWIQLEEETGGDGHGHGHPAPRLELEAAAPGAELVHPGPTEEPASPAAPTRTALDERAGRSSARPVAKGTQDDGMPPAVPLGVGAAVLALGGAGAWWLRNRRSKSV
ncbi:DUF1775 domain-containing protein [Streptomyces sp. NPDC019990]|uniref:DUF1775 domain-containing protein n=1 Tax=Streptomyces sp. NPDC019990 TaxID=3154693 RepID=UPI0033F51772